MNSIVLFLWLATMGAGLLAKADDLARRRRMSREESMAEEDAFRADPDVW